MVFPSVPVYLDPPNWNYQQPGHQQAIGGAGGGVDAHRLPPAPVQPRPEGNMAAGLAARPASMADRARLAKVPQPEQGLKCPRCESTNTKFCYFNNYSLSQPRHFCKTCRRYWTRGGALRNVPVGGGCRRNKRPSKIGGGSKSSAASADRQAGTSASSVTSAAGGGGGASAIPSSVPPQPQLPFMASLHSVADYGAPASIGLGFGGQPIDAVSFQVGGSSGSAGLEQWRIQQVQQFPFLAGLEPPPAPPSLGLFPFNGQGVIDGGTGGFAAGQVQGKPSGATALNTHPTSVKTEEEPEGINFPRQYLGVTRNDQFWGAGAGGGSTGGGNGNGSGWTDLSGFNSASSCSNIL